MASFRDPVNASFLDLPTALLTADCNHVERLDKKQHHCDVLEFWDGRAKAVLRDRSPKD